MELGKAIELWLGEHKASTVHAYRSALVPMRDWLGPARKVSDIKPEHLLEYVQATVYKRPYSPATRQKHIKSIKTFFNWCVLIELIPGNSPAKVVRGKKLPMAIDRHKAMTDGELSKLLESLRYKPRDYALVMFLADTGCRRAGAVGLQMKDIQWDELVATVTEKGEKTRKVAFGKNCARAIRHWLLYRSEHHKVKGAYIFTRDGLPMQAENVSLIIRRACKAAGVRVLSSHSLRHRKGHQLADARVAPSIAAAALGHSDPIITLTYYYPADWESAKQALRELVTNPDKIAAPNPKVVNFSE